MFCPSIVYLSVVIRFFHGKSRIQLQGGVPYEQKRRQSLKRVDAYDKATGRAKYTDDLCGREALIVKICHSTIAHGFVKRIDTAAAERIPGVVRVLTCFDVPEFPFPTAGHPWSTDPAHQDVADRLLLNRHVRYYGDEVAVVIAEDEVAAAQGVQALEVEYEAALRPGPTKGYGGRGTPNPRGISRQHP